MRNLSVDNPKQDIRLVLVSQNENGFTVEPTAPPATANYQIIAIA